jgi:hypothetical protein
MEVGTEELEKGLVPAPAADFVKIAIVTSALLLVFNSAALLEWTRQPRPGPVIALLEGPARHWHDAMVWVGAASIFKRLRELAK